MVNDGDGGRFDADNPEGCPSYHCIGRSVRRCVGYYVSDCRLHANVGEEWTPARRNSAINGNFRSLRVPG